MDIKREEWIVEADIASMQAAMEEGMITSENIVKIYLDRIHKYDSNINSILEINPDAMDKAKALDKERLDQGRRGQLHGIPVLIKDNIDTHYSGRINWR